MAFQQQAMVNLQSIPVCKSHTAPSKFFLISLNFLDLTFSIGTLDVVAGHSRMEI